MTYVFNGVPVLILARRQEWHLVTVYTDGIAERWLTGWIVYNRLGSAPACLEEMRHPEFGIVMRPSQMSTGPGLYTRGWWKGSSSIFFSGVTKDLVVDMDKAYIHSTCQRFGDLPLDAKERFLQAYLNERRRIIQNEQDRDEKEQLHRGYSVRNSNAFLEAQEVHYLSLCFQRYAYMTPANRRQVRDDPVGLPEMLVTKTEFAAARKDHLHVTFVKAGFMKREGLLEFKRIAREVLAMPASEFNGQRQAESFLRLRKANYRRQYTGGPELLADLKREEVGPLVDNGLLMDIDDETKTVRHKFNGTST